MEDEELDLLIQQARERRQAATVPPARTGIADRAPTVGGDPRAQAAASVAAGRDRQRGFFDRVTSPAGIRSLARGATFGASDNIEAGLRAPFSEESFGEIRDGLFAQRDSLRAEPGGTALEMLGGVAGGDAVVRGLGALVKATPAPVQAASQFLTKTPIRAGATGGAAYAGMQGENPVTGALLGGGATAGLSALLRVPALAGDMVTRFRNPGLFDERMAQAAGRSAVQRMGGPEAVQAKAASAGPSERVLEQLPMSERRVVRGQQTLGGETGTRVDDIVGASRQGATERVQAAVEKGLGGKAIDAEEASSQILAGARELADQSYSGVFERGTTVEGPELVRLLRNKNVRSAWERVTEIDRNLRDAGQAGRYHLDIWKDTPGATGTGTNLPATIGSSPGREMALYDDFIERSAMDLRSVDALKRGLDDILKNGHDGKTVGGLRGEAASSVRALKTKLVELADAADDAGRQADVGLSGRGTDIVREGEAATPGKSYREARKEFETAMSWREALADGGDFMQMPAEQLRTQFAALTPEQREIAKVGFRTRVLDQMGKSDVARDRTRGLLGSPQFREKVKIMWGDEADDFFRAIDSERRVADTDNFLRGGSNTAPRQNDPGVGKALGEVADGARALTSPARFADYAWRKGVGAVDRLATGTAGRAGGILTDQYMRPASETGDFLTWLAKASRTQPEMYRENLRAGARDVTRAGAMFGGVQ